MGGKDKRGSIIVGIDPSLTKTGVAAIGGKSGQFLTSCLLNTTKTDRLSPFERVWSQVKQLSNFLRDLPQTPDIIGIEDFAYIQNNRAMYETGELIGAIKLYLFKRGIPILFTISEKKKKGRVYSNVLMVGPAQTKKYAVGKQSAAKGKGNRVPIEVYKQWGLDFETDDEADAYVIARITRDVLNRYFCKGFENENNWQKEVVDKIAKGAVIVIEPGEQIRKMEDWNA